MFTREYLTAPNHIGNQKNGLILTILRRYKSCSFKKKNNSEKLPDKWMNKLDSFQRIIVIKCLRPDKVTNSMQDYVSENIGQRFIEPQVIH
jgi:dynein heavy chain